MRRSVKVSLKLATARKLRRLDHLTRRLRKLTNKYIALVWVAGGELDAATLNAIPSSLGYRQRSDCLKYALEITSSTRAAAQSLGTEPSMPVLRRSFKFSSLTATAEPGKGSFDFVLKISSLVPGKRVVLPFKSHKRLNHWLAKPGVKLLNGCIIKGDQAVLWLDIPDLAPITKGAELGVDLGYNKLLADSEGGMYGAQVKAVCEKVRRKQPGSRGKRRARTERDQYINHAVKQLPWGRIKVIAVEDLRNLKKGKKPNRNKEFRKRMAPWTYRQALLRIGHLAQENRVCLVSVDHRNTSRKCPICGSVSAENRRGEKFHCTRCGYTAHADTNGARNIIDCTRGNSWQPMVAGSSKA